MILAHEIGHWMSYKQNKRGTNISRNDREKLAYEMGWHILTNTKLYLKFHITNKDWHELNFYNFTNTSPDTKMAWE